MVLVATYFTLWVQPLLLQNVHFDSACVLRLQEFPGVIHAKYLHLFTQQTLIVRLLYADVVLGTWKTSVEQNQIPLSLPKCVFCLEEGDGKEKNIYDIDKYDE